MVIEKIISWSAKSLTNASFARMHLNICERIEELGEHEQAYFKEVAAAYTQLAHRMEPYVKQSRLYEQTMQMKQLDSERVSLFKVFSRYVYGMSQMPQTLSLPSKAAHLYSVIAPYKRCPDHELTKKSQELAFLCKDLTSVEKTKQVVDELGLTEMVNLLKEKNDAYIDLSDERESDESARRNSVYGKSSLEIRKEICTAFDKLVDVINAINTMSEVEVFVSLASTINAILAHHKRVAARGGSREDEENGQNVQPEGGLPNPDANQPKPDANQPKPEGQGGDSPKPGGDADQKPADGEPKPTPVWPEAKPDASLV